MSRDAIKYIAMLTMLLNHIARIFMETGTLLGEVFTDIGYFTAITMCYFLVEGYGYTKSKKKYGERLLVFAAVSELPYCLAFSGKEYISFTGMNMIFTLFLCFLIIRTMKECINPAVRSFAIAGLIILSLFSDWAIMAPVFTILFVNAGKDHTKIRNAFLTGTLVFGGFNLLGALGRFDLSTTVLYTLGSMVGPAVAGCCICCFYNGKKAQNHRRFSKWFFYWFYPVHLLILGIVRIAML